MPPDRALAERIAAHADALARRSTARMYEDPFWEARFGTRGRRYAEEDGRHHVDHLVLALQIGNAGPIAQYARWLRVVLTTRGMCSRHIEQNFTRLGEAIDEAGIEEAEVAHALLRDGARALRPEVSSAAALFDARVGIAERARALLDAAHGGQAAPGDDTVPGSTADHLATLASFLADAVALSRPEVLAKHAAWLSSWTTGGGRDPGYVPALLGAIEAALDGAVSDGAARSAASAAIVEARAAAQ